MAIHAAWFNPLEKYHCNPLVPQFSNRWTLISRNWMNRRGPCPTSGCWVLASPCISPVFEGPCMVTFSNQQACAKWWKMVHIKLQRWRGRPEHLWPLEIWSRRIIFQTPTLEFKMWVFRKVLLAGSNFGNGLINHCLCSISGYIEWRNVHMVLIGASRHACMGDSAYGAGEFSSYVTSKMNISNTQPGSPAMLFLWWLSFSVIKLCHIIPVL